VIRVTRRYFDLFLCDRCISDMHQRAAEIIAQRGGGAIGA
jgi:hypothetical protein